VRAAVISAFSPTGLAVWVAARKAMKDLVDHPQVGVDVP